MGKTYKSFIIIFMIVIATLLYFLKKYNDILNQNAIDIHVSKNIELINSELTNQKKHALSLAILFSKNQHVIDYLKNKESIKLKKELNSLIKIISNYTQEKNIQIQVHTKELKVFVRSWEDKDKGLDLKKFRAGLIKVKNTKQPYVSNELGKRLNIKAIAPIFDGAEYIGSLEVIMDYTMLKKRLQIVGIDILPILNKKFLNIAKYHQNNKKLAEFILTEKNYDKKLFDIISHNKYILKENKFYYEIENKIVSKIPLGLIEDENVGYLVVSFNKTFDEFNYLPKYEFTGGLVLDKSEENLINKKNEILIK